MPKKDILGPRKTIFTNIFETQISQVDFEFKANCVPPLHAKYTVSRQGNDSLFDYVARDLGPQKPKLCFTKESSYEMTDTFV